MKPPKQAPRVTIDEISDSSDKKRHEPKLAYGRPARPLGGDHINDRVHSLERENLKLKSKENLLALEIRKYAISDLNNYIGCKPSSTGSMN